VQTAKGFNTNFDMVDLPLLVNIGEQQSLTHGAERSHLSLPSASVRIKTMEESVGTRLLLRSKQGTTLTPAGNVALQHARLVSRPDRKHDGDLLEYGDGLKGHVRLFANATSISGSLPEVLRRYLTENPRVDVDLRERLSDEGVRAVARALPTSRLWRVRPIPTGWRRFLTQPRSWCSSPRQVIRLHSASGSISPTLEFDYVSLQEGSALHRFLVRRADEHRRASLNTRIRVASYDAIRRLEEADVGIGILPLSAVRRNSQETPICVIRLNDPWSLRQSLICVRSLAFLPAFCQKLVAMLRDSAASSSWRN
jgi:DNA-binding transcriptional LysR family regulator